MPAIDPTIFLANKTNLLEALALLIGGATEEQISKMEKFSDLPEDVQEKAIIEYNKQGLDKLAKSKKKLQQPDIQDAMSKIAKTKATAEPQYFKVVNPGDGKTCESCKAWIGKTLSDEDPNYPSTKDFLKSGGMHPNCRCSLHLLEEVDEIQKKAQDYLERRRKREQELAAFEAFNSTPIIEFVFN